jgi:hypothetical protein
LGARAPTILRAYLTLRDARPCHGPPDHLRAARVRGILTPAPAAGAVHLGCTMACPCWAHVRSTPVRSPPRADRARPGRSSCRSRPTPRSRPLRESLLSERRNVAVRTDDCGRWPRIDATTTVRCRMPYGRRLARHGLPESVPENPLHECARPSADRRRRRGRRPPGGNQRASIAWAIRETFEESDTPRPHADEPGDMADATAARHAEEPSIRPGRPRHCT